jgi:hypothetical protein
VLAASVAAAVGCAAGAQQAAAPRSPAFAPVGPTPTTIDDAVADIDRWRQVLGVSSEHASAESAVSPAPGSPSAPPPPPAAPVAEPQTTYATAPPADAAEPSKDARADSDERTAAPPPECVTPCKAIASMRRSVDALCRLAGDGDARCIDARGTLARSEQRVARCGC